MASIIKVDTIQSTTANVFILNSSGTEYARFNSTGVFQLANPITFPAGTAAAPSITATGDTNTGLYFPAADTVGVSTGGSERVRVNSSGNVGIGTSSPTSKLQVSNGSAVDTQVQITNSLSTLKLSSFSDGTGAVETTGNYALRLFTNATERMRIDTSGNLQFNSGYGSVATAYGCRAWVNFNGTGVVAIRASGNVSSITDNGTGNYTVNFTTAMPDANYAANATCDEYFDSVTSKTTGGCTVTNSYQTSLGGALAFIDNDNVSVIVFR